MTPKTHKFNNFKHALKMNKIFVSNQKFIKTYTEYTILVLLFRNLGSLKACCLSLRTSIQSSQLILIVLIYGKG